MTLDFIFRLVLCSRDDVSFNIICLNMLEGIKQLYLLTWFKKYRPETPLKGDNVKALKIFCFVLEKSSANILCFFGFQ